MKFRGSCLRVYHTELGSAAQVAIITGEGLGYRRQTSLLSH
jgi:hypothetical protein